MNRPMRCLVLVVLCLALFVPVGHAESTAQPSPASESPGMLTRIWDWVGSVLGDGGSFIDPFGGGNQGLAGSGQGISDGGSFIDPFGGN
jgi:hypothetical protein